MMELYQPHHRRFDEVAAAILARIRSGELQPGDRLPPERKLVEEFGVSRTAVREALRSLAAQGLIDSYVGRGTFVRQPTIAHLAAEIGLFFGNSASSASDLRTARLLVERALADRAVEHADDEALDAVAQAHAQGQNAAFYNTLAAAAGAPLLGPLLTALCMLEPCERIAQKSSKALVVALHARDAEAVREAFAGARAATPLAV